MRNTQEIIQQYTKMIAGLVRIQSKWNDSGPHVAGICYKLHLECSDISYAYREMALYEAFKCWPKYSGNCDYPIHGRILLDDDGFIPKSYWSWDRTTEVGKLRFELLTHCIVYFQRKLEQARTAYRLEQAEIEADNQREENDHE